MNVDGEYYFFTSPVNWTKKCGIIDLINILCAREETKGEQVMKRFLLWVIVVVIMIGFAGCGKNQEINEERLEVEPAINDMSFLTSIPVPTEATVPTATNTPTPTVTNTPIPTATVTPSPLPTNTPTPSPTPTNTPTPTPTPTLAEGMGLSEQQMNSFSMLYYLAITAERIRTAKDSRLMLDDIYTSLLNDINPGSIDETTQDHLQNLRDIIKSYINISVKRDRLQYIYNQDKAANIRSAVPNPLAILSMTSSFNWKALATSVAYTVVDSYTEYKSANASTNQEFLMSGWELDDEEADAIRKNRERAFDYMVDIVQEYDLDGKLTLNEKAIETFAKICEIESVQQKIRRLESEEETYKLLGDYWLELAECYYQTAQYKKCLECVGKYNELSMGIYRKDYNYVQILPKAIVAAQEIYVGEEYITCVQAFNDAIMENTTTEEWSTRYFAAQVYLDLYVRTKDCEYLEAAYNIAYDNVTILLDEQRKLNTTYLEEVQEVTVSEPDYRFMTEKEKEEAKKEYKAEQKRLKAYNKALMEARETELPPLYEPLVLNCDLLFALANEMGISYKEQAEIEDILRTDENGVFLSDPINSCYSFTTVIGDYSIDFTKDKIIVPVNLLTASTEVIVSVSDGGKTTIFDDCVVDKVEREGDVIDTFKATISSKLMKDYSWTENSKVAVKIINGDKDNPLVVKFKVVEFKDNWLIADKVVFAEE